MNPLVVRYQGEQSVDPATHLAARELGDQQLPASSAETGDSGTSLPGPSSTPSRPLVLQGGVEHSRRLPSLDEKLIPGSVFREDVLLKPERAANNDWFWIPSWYAGTRHTDDVLIVYRYDYNTGQSTKPMLQQMERQDSLSGYQRDRDGGIWEFNNTPYVHHVESGAVLAALLISEMTPLTVNDKQIVLRYREVSITYSRKNHIILDVVQQEQINTITPLEPGTLRTDISVKSFDRDGKPQRSEQSIAFNNITAPFHPIDEFEGKNLRSMFRDFLISHHKENLVPDNVKD